MMNEREIFLTAVNKIPGIKSSAKIRLIRTVKDLDSFLKLTSYEAGWHSGSSRIKDFNAGFLVRDAEQEMKQYPGIGRIFMTDGDYPTELKDVYDSPFLLYIRGERPDPSRIRTAVVGTRMPTQSALRRSFSIAYELGFNNIDVVSGLALGIDGAAHKGNILGGGRTLAVLGNGVESIYPPSHKQLAREILESGGALISEFAPGTLPLRYNFPKRNRIISGLSRCVIVAQAPLRSGALITADYALEQGRDLCVFPEGLLPGAGEGTRILKEEGAAVVEKIADLTSLLGRLSFREGLSELAVPETGKELSMRMKQELDGRIINELGGCFASVR